MKKPSLPLYLFFIIIIIILFNIDAYSQITGSSGSLAVDPSNPTIVDPAITVSGTVDITNVTVQITENLYAGDNLNYDQDIANNLGISGNYNPASGVLSFTGTTSPANWQDLLRTVTYDNSQGACGPGSRKIQFMTGSSFYNLFNGHYYEYVDGSYSWKDSKAGAAARTYNGMQGYLATLTSEAENNFAWKIVGQVAWIGAADDYEEINEATGSHYTDPNDVFAEMYWVTGPEKGTLISTGLNNPVSPNGEYMNWNSGEPNGYPYEAYGHIYPGNGKWNDEGDGANKSYLVEYGGLPGDVPENNSFARDISITTSIAGEISGGNIQVCKGSSAMLTSSANGSGISIVRWESSTDNFLTSGTVINSTSSTLTINNITETAFYRAIISGNSCPEAPSASVKITVSGLNTWLGTNSADFGDAANWSCHVPLAGEDLKIGTSAPNMPQLDQNRSLGSITFENNTTIDINGYILTINGSLTGSNTGTFIGSASSSLHFTGSGDAGTIYFNQGVPGASNALHSFVMNRDSSVVPTPPSSPLCNPDATWGDIGVGITNVTLESINNTTTAKNGYTNYFKSQSATLDPSTDYSVSVTTNPGYGGDQGIKVWIDWNNNGVFGDEGNEIITDYGGGPQGTYNFDFTAPAIGGDISGGSKTMRIYVDDYGYLNWFDACYGGTGEYEDYKINLTPVPLANGSVTLGNDLSIANTVTFTKGLIKTGSNLLIFSEGSSATGTSNASHATGNIRKVGNTAFTFPVGDDTYYAPVGISAPADAADHFTVSYSRADPLSVYTNSTLQDNLVGLSSNEYWNVERTNGSSNVTVTLSWDAARSSTLTELGALRVAHWDGAEWRDAGNAKLTTGDLNAGTVTSNIVTSFSPFTIGISSVILPVTDLNFKALKANQKVNLVWQTSAEVNSNRFEIERSNDGINWTKIGQLAAMGTSTRTNSYSFTDNNPGSGNNYYRLKQFDNNGGFVYSPIRIINFSALANVTVYPNPFRRTITIDGGNTKIGDILVADLSGRIVYRARITNTKGTINLDHLAPGQYTVIQNGGSYFKIIKL